jgi:hypothetical protein
MRSRLTWGAGVVVVLVVVLMVITIMIYNLEVARLDNKKNGARSIYSTR